MTVSKGTVTPGKGFISFTIPYDPFSSLTLLKPFSLSVATASEKDSPITSGTVASTGCVVVVVS